MLMPARPAVHLRALTNEPTAKVTPGHRDARRNRAGEGRLEEKMGGGRKASTAVP